MKTIFNHIVAFITILLFVTCGNNQTKSKSDNSNQISSDSKIKGSWKVVNVTDEFGDVIPNKSTIAADFKGKMTNSASVDENLIVRLQIQDSTIYGVFYEYGSEPQAQLPDYKIISIKVKLSNGEVLTMKQFLYQNMIVDSKSELLKLLLSQDKPIKLIVDLNTVDEYSSTIYNYEIDPTGLKDLIK